MSPVHTAADADETVVAELGIADSPRIARDDGGSRGQRGSARARSIAAWILSFIATLFAIHIGRMGSDGTLLGFLAPAVAVAGDMFMASLITLLDDQSALPRSGAGRRDGSSVRCGAGMSRQDDAAARLVADGSLPRGCAIGCVSPCACARRATPFAPRSSQALQLGLPLAAVIAATVPVWGMSWYFDTENWAAGMWNSWAESRTDTWRAAMVRAVLADDQIRGRGRCPSPFGRRESTIRADFSFIVIGDTGRGRRLAAHPARSAARRRQSSRRSLRRDLVRRRLPGRRDEGLRGQVLAALQGRDEARLRDSRQP